MSNTSDPSVTWENITPEMAIDYLENNTRNRTLGDLNVTRYAADMKAGLWKKTGDAIRFSSSGRLLDGQHRLSAIIEAEVTVPMLVIRGLDDEAQEAMDLGRARKAGDILQLRGEKNATRIAASVRVFLTWKLDRIGKNAKSLAEITNSVIVQWIAENRDAVDSFNDMASTLLNNDAAPAIAGGAFLIFREINDEDAREFFTLLAHGAGGSGHPITTLDKRLARMRREKRIMDQREVLSMMIQAWNAWREGRELKNFKRPPAGQAWNESNLPKPI